MKFGRRAGNSHIIAHRMGLRVSTVIIIEQSVDSTRAFKKERELSPAHFADQASVGIFVKNFNHEYAGAKILRHQQHAKRLQLIL
ncbi:hypothetical protein PGTUg99_031786 [Puccinia graminis f. sp. tritici]|uniref:Uncharacterized protein n=1 Tax=Puccinia graminis f. sp. tritici TaxID=56615 RepID=A0A5B0P2L5_PUCGR|nr:hypothetical protein PGTUg99_031786 [Puccinia graminis f. sp. tritici]